jgi:hypothetical protein
MGIWDYEETQKKLSTPKDSATVETGESDETEDVDLSELEDETEEEEEEEEVEEEEEETEEEKEKQKIPEKKETVLPGIKDEDKQAIYDQVIKRVGEDTILKIRGKEQRVGDLSPEELIVALQKSIDTDRRYQELAAQRKQLEMDRALVEKGAAAAQQILEQYNQKGGIQRGTPSLPDYLRPNAEDPEDVKAFKEHIVRQAQELDALKQYITSTESTGKQKQVVDEILQFRETYPMASVDEVIAVKDVRPDINSEDLMRASHEYYTSAKFLENAIKASPTFKREYEQKIIRNYIASQKKAKTLPGKRQGVTREDRVNVSSEKPSGLFDFDKAENLAAKYLKEISRIEKEG